jgi:hypothetical protein
MFKDFYKLNLFVIFHPFQGFDDMKFGKRGRKSMILFNLLFFWVSYSFYQQYAGFSIRYVNVLSLNSINNAIGIVTVFLVAALANWMVTALMDGEGRFVDIAMTLAYAITPICLIWIPATIMSNAFTHQEAAFFHMVISVSVAWSALLAFIGLIIVHNYTLFKMLFVLLLTVVALMVILYIAMLVSALYQQMFMFVYSIFTELRFR